MKVGPVRAAHLRALLAADARSVRRDGLLLGVLLMAPALVLILRLGAEPAIAAIAPPLGVSAALLRDLVAAILLLFNAPTLFGLMAGFLIIEERDAGVLAALRATPVSMRGLGAYRIGAAAALAAATVWLGLPLSGLGAEIAPALLPAPALAAGALAAPAALTLAAYAPSKLEALALLKGLGALTLGAAAAALAPGPAQWLFGVLPTFWAAQAMWLALAAGPEPSTAEAALVWLCALVGMVSSAALAWALARRFEARMDL